MATTILLFGGIVHAKGNRFEKFSIQQCFESSCATARSDLAYVDNVGQSISASKVVLEIRQHGKTRTFRCDDFRADLFSNSFVCDNRNAGVNTPSVIVSKDLRVSVL